METSPNVGPLSVVEACIMVRVSKLRNQIDPEEEIEVSFCLACHIGSIFQRSSQGTSVQPTRYQCQEVLPLNRTLEQPGGPRHVGIRNSVIVFFPRHSKIANLVPPAIEAGPLPNRTYGALYQDTSRHIFNEKPLPSSRCSPFQRAKLPRCFSRRGASQLFIGMFGGASDYPP
jgi:hypothetical protein